MSDRGVRSVLLLCWRDTGHPQGGGSETYLQRIGTQLAASGVEVTLRTARYPGSARREIVDGVRVSRAGGSYSIYIWAGLAMVLARIGLGPLRRVRPDVVIDSQNGIPFLARLAYGRRVAVLVHHCHREQWPVAGPAMGRFGWFVESRLSPWLHRRGSLCCRAWCRTSRSRTHWKRSPNCVPACRGCTWTSWAAAGGNGAWWSTSSYSASPTR